ncbi:MAG: hypothetical protein COB67_00660 [SAR324 cluster bacterium]|uniref:Uncharacterized protein n=1 Tax=SAR324 cluster bacterium TaxID=2024889 RepID=A0A2A4TBT9_9DELT|nr:MAG: hypothetical protein COB67_00660 [SAR324 cluster bacterium]
MTNKRDKEYPIERSAEMKKLVLITSENFLEKEIFLLTFKSIKSKDKKTKEIVPIKSTYIRGRIDCNNMLIPFFI